MIRWFFRVLSLVVVLAGLFFLGNDYYQRNLNDGVLLQRAIIKTLTSHGFRFSITGSFFDEETGKTIQIVIKDGKLERYGPLVYNISGHIDVQQDGKQILQEGFVYNYGNLYLNSEILKPENMLFLVPLKDGWKSFAAAHSYQDIFFDTYLPFSIRTDLSKKGEVIEEKLRGSKLLQSYFSFRPKNWLASVDVDKKSDHEAFFNVQSIENVAAVIYDIIRNRSLDFDQQKYLKESVAKIADWSIVGVISEDGYIDSLQLKGIWSKEQNVKIEWQLSEVGNDRLVVKSPEVFQHYKDFLSQMTGEDKMIVFKEDPKLKEDLFSVFSGWSMVDDTDEDGLVDAHETFFGTDIKKQDTDGDGFSDSQEIKNGFSPY